MEILEQIVIHTPFWVWILLFILIKRGIAATKDREVSIQKASILPIIFIVWGLEKIFYGFSYTMTSFIIYFCLMSIGTLVGIILYSSQKFYLKNNILFKKGSFIPLFVIVMNFSIKYCLNVAISMQPQLIQELQFNIFYSAISGFSVGLFVGGMIITLQNKNKYKH